MLYRTKRRPYLYLAEESDAAWNAAPPAFDAPKFDESLCSAFVFFGSYRNCASLLLTKPRWPSYTLL